MGVQSRHLGVRAIGSRVAADELDPLALKALHSEAQGCEAALGKAANPLRASPADIAPPRSSVGMRWRGTGILAPHEVIHYLFTPHAHVWRANETPPTATTHALKALYSEAQGCEAALGRARHPKKPEGRAADDGGGAGGDATRPSGVACRVRLRSLVDMR